jgi:hypothetical protein
MATRSMPAARLVAGILTDLLGRKVDVGKGKPVVMSPRSAAIVGVYCRDDGSVGAACAAELGFAAHAGAALAMIPAGIAAESIRANTLGGDLFENFCEVLNVGASFINLPGAPHLAFRTAHVSPPPLPDGVAALLAKPATRLDLDIKIAGYGGGCLSILAS